MLDKVYIELSDICGLKCSFCPQNQRVDSRGIMSVENFRRVCESLVAPKRLTNRVCLHILGDPLAVKNIEMYCQILDEYHLRVDLVSNAKFLCANHFKLLSQTPIHQVAFSLSAFVDSKQNFPKEHLQNIVAFCKFHAHSNSEVFIHLRLQEKHLQAHFTQSLDKNPITQEVLECIANAFDKNIQDMLTSLQGKEGRVRLAYKTFLTKSRDFKWVERDSHSFRQGANTQSKNLYCYGVHKQLGILSNGVVVPCCIDVFGEIALGNIQESCLYDILQSPLARQIAQNFKVGKAIMPKCQQCDYARGLRINA